MVAVDSWRKHIPLFILGLAILCWLWPIGLGGKMPVGGDVTQFSLGLMGVLSRSLHEGRIPYWNNLWGYGFPGVGESQMGFYYPPHWILYGLFSTEKAYTISLVMHTLWGALGSYDAARRFGASEVGSALGAFAWTTCGFFMIHLPHQWGYTTGSWMPWAWGLTWSILVNSRRNREPFLLAIVLTMQLLPGHFQLAFCTQVGILVLVGVTVLESWLTRTRDWIRWFEPLGSIGSAYFIAGAQLWPTYRLARLAAPRRDFEYLSGFAASPLHLISFIAPGLFEQSPLWRPLVWDPFHTSPEEYLGFVGVVPFYLALGAIGSRFRCSASVRALTTVGLATLLLALGPYLPLYPSWCLLPGFSFFRAPARWILATSLALSCLAALGFDSMAHWKHPAFSLIRFAFLAMSAIAVVVIGVEVGLAGGNHQGDSWVASIYEKTLESLPWHETTSYARISKAARLPNLDPRVQETWARQGVLLSTAPLSIFSRQHLAIYREELGVTALVFGAFILLAPLAKWRRFPLALILLTGLELGWLGRQRRFDLGPIETLDQQSPVLAKLADLYQGWRSIDRLRNLPMVAGVAPVSAYRTLDLPALESLTILAGQLPMRDLKGDTILQAIHATGAGIRIFDPSEVEELKRRGISWPIKLEEIHDPALAGWRFGTDWVSQQGLGAHTFHLGLTPQPVARAWVIPWNRERSRAIRGEWSGDPRVVLDTLAKARPLVVRSTDPEHSELSFSTDESSIVVMAQLADPEWEAVLDGSEGRREARLHRAFGRRNQGAWQAVLVPDGGDWTLHLTYRGRDVLQGLAISAASCFLLTLLYVRRGACPVILKGEIS
ncbi:MAG: hypothetical protein NVSMB9_19060 [Isosphaeraceae bacterium]